MNKLRASLSLLLAPSTLLACAEPEPETIESLLIRTEHGVVSVSPAPIDDDTVLVMGDIRMRRDDLEAFRVEPENLEAELARAENDALRGAIRAAGSFRWVDGVIPFEIADELTDEEEGWAQDAMAHWEAVTPFRFVAHDGENDFIRFISGTTCSSFVGRIGSRQDVDVGDCAPTAVGNTPWGRVAHELGHAVGLYHEQSRTDRDTYVTIDPNNTCPDQYETFITRGRDGQNVGPYDFGSIMHYSGTQCDTGNGDAIVPRVAGVTIGQRNALSLGDRYTAFALFHGSKLVSTGPQVTLYRDASFQGVSQSFLPGFYNNGAAANYIGTVGDNLATSLRVPPGLAARLCVDNGEPDLGSCAWFTTDTTQLSASLDNRVSAVSIERALTVYSGQNLTGTRQTLRRGTYYASQGGLGAVGDNNISSLVVPPGLVAELCRDESVNWPQLPVCVTVGATANTMVALIDNQTSLVRVKAAATLWQESRNWGNQKALVAGTYDDSASWSPVNGISSVSVGDGLQVRMCDFSDGTGGCQAFKGDVQFIGPDLNDKVSYVKVEAAQ